MIVGAALGAALMGMRPVAETEEDYVVPFGQAAIHRVGSHATVIALGRMVQRVLTAAEQLAEDNISVNL